VVTTIVRWSRLCHGGDDGEGQNGGGHEQLARVHMILLFGLDDDRKRSNQMSEAETMQREHRSE
jgi:hypothetical protein